MREGKLDGQYLACWVRQGLCDEENSLKAIDRVDEFIVREDNDRLAELFSDDMLQFDAECQAYSVKEIYRLFSIS